jgi:hypothetical protein
MTSDGDGARADGRPAAYFGGCYFSATGRNPNDGQAYVKGVLFDKLIEYQSKVEWTDQALRAESRFRAAVWTGWAVAAVLSVSLAWFLS